MKKLLTPITAVLIVALLLQTVIAADITGGHIFVPNETDIDHTDMNAIVGDAVINTDFFTAKSAAAPVAADVFLYYSVANSAFRKATLNQVLLQNTALITSQSEDGTPANSDFVLTYDTSAGSLKKVALQNLTAAGSTNLFVNFPVINPPLLSALVGLSQGSSNAAVTLSNLVSFFRTNIGYVMPFTNLAAHTAPTNGDAFLVFDSVGGSNKQVTLGSLYTNLPTAFKPASNTRLTVMHSNVVSTITLGQLLTNFFFAPQYSALTNEMIPGSSAGFNYGNGWPRAAPYVRVTILCTNTFDTYSAGDELDALALQDPGLTNVFSVTYKQTASVSVAQTARPIRVLQSGSSTLYTNLNQTNWNIKVTAILFPQ